LAGLPLAGVLAGCGRGQPDPLVALTIQARSDATRIDTIVQVLRTGSTPSTDPALADALAAVADARRTHAEALAVELADEAPPPLQGTVPNAEPTGPTAKQSTATARPTAPSIEPTAPISAADTALTSVLAVLDKAHQRAAAVVPSLPRSHAALVGSIAACCAAYRAVLH